MIPPVEEIKEIRSNFERKMKEVNQLHLSKDKYILIQKNLSEYYQELDKILFYGTSPLYKLKRKREFKELKATLDKEFILWVESNDNISIENKSELKAFISKENSKNI